MHFDDYIKLDHEKQQVVFCGRYILNSKRIYNIIKEYPKHERLHRFVHSIGYESLSCLEDYTKYYDIQKGDVVVDAGAHVGVFTRKFSEAVGSTGKVLAFEPDFRLVGLLTQNSDDLKNVDIYPYGLWDEEDYRALHIPGKYWGSSSFTHFHSDDTQWNPVRVLTLDQIIDEQNIGKVNFVKMDVEGSEIRILKGMKKTLRNVDALAIASYHYMEDSITERTQKHVAKFLRDEGFNIREEVGYDGEIVYANRR